VTELAHPQTLEDLDHLVLQLPARTTNALAQGHAPVRSREACVACKALTKEARQGGLLGDVARCLLAWHGAWEQSLHEARTWVLCFASGYASDPDPGPSK